jgi:hypothetical protein
MEPVTLTRKKISAFSTHYLVDISAFHSLRIIWRKFLLLWPQWGGGRGSAKACLSTRGSYPRRRVLCGRWRGRRVTSGIPSPENVNLRKSLKYTLTLVRGTDPSIIKQK